MCLLGLCDTGVAVKGNAFSAEQAQSTLDINFYGTASVSEAISPLMPSGSRIVNVSSTMGKSHGSNK